MGAIEEMKRGGEDRPRAYIARPPAQRGRDNTGGARSVVGSMGHQDFLDLDPAFGDCGLQVLDITARIDQPPR